MPFRLFPWLRGLAVGLDFALVHRAAARPRGACESAVSAPTDRRSNPGRDSPQSDVEPAGGSSTGLHVCLASSRQKALSRLENDSPRSSGRQRLPWPPISLAFVADTGGSYLAQQRPGHRGPGRGDGIHEKVHEGMVDLDLERDRPDAFEASFPALPQASEERVVVDGADSCRKIPRHDVLPISCPIFPIAVVLRRWVRGMRFTSLSFSKILTNVLTNRSLWTSFIGWRQRRRAAVGDRGEFDKILTCHRT